jgi:hypothetical protein
MTPGLSWLCTPNKEDAMPLDGTASVALDLREAMFELRPPHIETKVFDFPSKQPITTKVLTTPIVRREVMGLVELCGKHQRLMSQHADVVPIVAKRPA